MSKSHRGKGLSEHISKGRGICPLCKKTGIKLLYEITSSNDAKVTLCKECNKAVTHGKKVAPAS